MFQRKPILKPVELWEDINEMILHHWEQLNITGNPKWLIIKDRYRNRKISKKRFEEAFFNLHDQYSDIAGSSGIIEKYRILVEKLIEARVLVKDDPFMKNWIRRYEAEIKALMSGSEDVDIIKQRMYYQKLYGQKIDAKQTTVGEYIRIIQVVEEDISRKNNSNARTDSE